MHAGRSCPQQSPTGWWGFAVSYTLTDDHELHIDYELTAEDPTVLSPTNHAYFNLNMPNDITTSQLCLMTDRYAPKSSIGMPDGRLASTIGTPLDFTTARTFGDGLASPKTGDFANWKIYDDFYFLPGNGYRKVAEVYCPENGRVMETHTDQTALILFTPRTKSATVNKGHHMEGHVAFCLETQYMPNAVNCPEYPSPVYRRGETMRSRTTYKFGIK